MTWQYQNYLCFTKVDWLIIAQKSRSVEKFISLTNFGTIIIRNEMWSIKIAEKKQCFHSFVEEK